MREDYQRLVDEIKQQYNIDMIWSYSKVNSFKQDRYSWFLNYIKCIPSDKQDGGAYGIYGNMVHDIMEDYYNGKISRNDCVTRFNDEWDKLSMLNLKFDNTDDDRESRLKNKYHYDIEDFMNTFTTLDGENYCEMPIGILLENDKYKEGFLGYIDFLNIIDNNGKKHYNIIDYKTSTVYKGDALYEHAKQLLLYSIGIMQKYHCSHDDITLGWNFLKYVKVKEEQKNGSIKDRVIERIELYEKLENSIVKWLKTYNYNGEEIDYICNQCMIHNNLDFLPQNVKSKFQIEDCIITIEFNDIVESTITNTILEQCHEIRKIVKEYNETQNEDLFMWEVTPQDEFYIYNLCDYTSQLHKPFANYLAKKEQKENEDKYISNEPINDSLDDFFKNL